MPLTAKQQRFVDEYLIDLNATQAAIRAGYSEKTARSVGSENLTKPDVAAAIKKGRAKVAERAEWSAADRLKSLKTIHDTVLEKDPRVAISAIGEANKMQGSHAAAKHHLSGTVQVVTITAKHLDGLNDDELAALEAAYPVLQKLGLIGSDQVAEAEPGSEPED